MPLNPETADIQNRLAQICRTGEIEAIPGAKQDRLKEYRQLVHSVINNTFEQAFPITYQFLKEAEWELLINSFLKEHACQESQVWKLPLEFYEYVKEKDFEQSLGYPFLNELLYFEWLEIEIHTMPDMVLPEYSIKGNFEKDKIVLNPEHEMMELTYPVHLLPVQEAIQHKGSYVALIFREQESGKVKFMNISALHVFLIESLTKEVLLLEELLVRASAVFNINNDKLLLEHTLLFFQDLRNEGMILGFKLNN
jgi:hypothetical protein